MGEDTDPFGRAIYDHHHGERTAPLLQYDGKTTREHPIESFYFGSYDSNGDRGDFWIRGCRDLFSTWERARDGTVCTFNSDSKRLRST